MRLKVKDISVFRQTLIERQQGECFICRVKLDTVVACLDHDHTTGRIRAVLCGNCNGIEGKIFNLCRRAKRERDEPAFLQSILGYWDYWQKNPRGEFHPSHRTADEKRLRRNKKARLNRKKNSG
jgi:hypothetical protein